MKLDKRIKEGKRPLDCFDTDVAKQFIGKNGYFADNNYAFIDITSDDYPICYATLTSVDEFQRIAFYDNFDVRHYYFLPEEWVKKELDHEIIFRDCRGVQHELSVLYGKLNILLNCICNQRYGHENPGDKSMVWHMRDILKKAYDDFKACLNEFEKGNY